MIFHHPTPDASAEWQCEQDCDDNWRRNQRKILPGQLPRAGSERFHHADLANFASHPKRDHAGGERRAANERNCRQDFEHAQHRGHEHRVRVRVGQRIDPQRGRVFRLQPRRQVVGEFADLVQTATPLEFHEQLIEIGLLSKRDATAGVT